MPRILSRRDDELTAGGGTLNLPVGESYELYRLFGAHTLTSSWTVQPQGTPRPGTIYKFQYRATLVLGAQTVTIFGWSLPAEWQGKKFDLECYYDGTSWIVNPVPAFDQADVLRETNFKDATVALAKLKALAEGSLIIGNNSNVAEALDAKGLAKILIGNATTLRSLSLTGPIGIDEDGLSSIAASSIEKSMLNFSIAELDVAYKVLTNTEVKALSGSPFSLIDAADIGAEQIVVPYAAFAFIKHSGTDWASPGDIVIRDTAGNTQHTFTEAFIEASGDEGQFASRPDNPGFSKGAGLQLYNPGIEISGGDDGSSFLSVAVLYSVFNF